MTSTESRWRGAVVALAVVTGSVVMGTASADATTPAWTLAAPLPGIAALNVGHNAGAGAVDCPTGLSCVAVGDFLDGAGHQQGWVDNMRSGVWQRAIEAPGLQALNVGGSAGLSSVACSSAGNCTAIGSYEVGSHHREAVVVNEIRGTWHAAQVVPGLRALQGTHPSSYFAAVSCAPGPSLDCTVGGAIEGAVIPNNGNPEDSIDWAVAASENKGIWAKIKRVPWPGSNYWSSHTAVGALSCPVAGTCTAVIDTTVDPRPFGSFVASEVNGTWSAVRAVGGVTPFTIPTNYNDRSINSASCPAAGDCSLAGTTYGSPGPIRVLESRGRWSTATGIPGLPDWTDGEMITCSSVGNCMIAGYYEDLAGTGSVYTVSQVSGVWSNASQLPGLSLLGHSGGAAVIGGLTCASIGDCTVTGSYFSSSGEFPFVDSSVGGVWGNATTVAGDVGVGTSGGVAESVSCASDGGCAVVGEVSPPMGRGTWTVFVSDRAPVAP